MKKQSKSLNEKFVPDKYQINTIKRIVSNPYQAIFSDPGFGKTMCILSGFQILQNKGYVDRLFVMSKRRIVRNVWPGEIFKWGLPLEYDILHGNKYRDELFMDGDSDVQLLNFESIPWLHQLWKKNKRRVNQILEGTMCAVDESTRIKNTNNKRHRMLRSLAPKMERRYIMTGTPTPRSLLDLWAQIWFLDFGKSLGTKARYKNLYFLPQGYMGYGSTPIDNAEEQIYKVLSKIVVRYSEELLDLPPVVIRPRYIDFPKEVMEVYDEMEQEFVAMLESGEVSAANAAVKSGKLRQISSGGVYSQEPGEKRKYHFIHHEKTEEMVDLIEELNGRPVIIAYEYQHDLERMREYLPDLESISGASDKRSDELCAKWDRGELPYIAGHYQSISLGLNLQEVDAAIICYTPTYDLEYFDQLIRRLKRRGSKAKRVFVYLLIGRGTVDEIAFKSTQEKSMNQRKLMKLFEEHFMPKKGGRKLMVSKVVEDRVNAIMSTAGVCKFKLPKWDGDADKFIRKWRGILATFSNEQYCAFIKCVLQETHKPVKSRKKSEIEAQKSQLMDKAMEALKEVFRYEYDEESSQYLIADHIFTVIYPTTEEGNETMSKFSGKESKKKVSKKKTASKKKVAKKAAAKKGRRFSSEKKVSSKKKASKKVAKKAASSELKGSFKAGEGTPVMQVRKDILDLVPKGAKGIKAQALLEACEDQLELSAKRATSHIMNMVARGFLEEK